MAVRPPSGTVTFLLTDLEGSTRMWEQEPEAMRAAMVRHGEILERTVAAHRGHVFSRMGDRIAAAFSSARDAAASAMAIKQALAEQDWHTASPLKARIGLHTAEAVVIDGNGYSSLPINRCFTLGGLRETGELVAAAVGIERARELRRTGRQ